MNLEYNCDYEGVLVKYNHMKNLRWANGAAEAIDNIDKICIGEYVMPLCPPSPHTQGHSVVT